MVISGNNIRMTNGSSIYCILSLQTKIFYAQDGYKPEYSLLVETHLVHNEKGFIYVDAITEYLCISFDLLILCTVVNNPINLFTISLLASNANKSYIMCNEIPNMGFPFTQMFCSVIFLNCLRRFRCCLTFVCMHILLCSSNRHLKMKEKVCGTLHYSPSVLFK